MKKLFHVALALMLCVSAAFAQEDIETRVGVLQAQVDRALAKAGIHFGGEFRSQFLNSRVSGGAVEDNQKKSESVEFTSVDFDIVARPNNALSARAMFRLHQDWRNFFSDVQNPITTRWLSVDGSAMQGVFKYNVGDYRKKLTPLTLWSPDVELLYEPEIFAQGRRLAMFEAFLGDNNRILQGANLELRAELGTEFSTILEELDLDIFGARLATRGTGESGVSPPPGIVTPPNSGYWDAEYDKYLVGFNFGTQIVKGVGLGVTDVMIFDYEASYRDLSEDTAKLHSQSTNVIAGRVNADNGMFMSDEFIRVGVKAEAAYSTDRRRYLDGTKVADSSVAGLAVNAGLFLRFAFNEVNNLNLTADYIQNDSAFRNDAAQSPSYIQRAVMNNENGLGGLGLMNPFDAMYRTVFKYTPSQYFGGPKPHTKNAYTNAILSNSAVEAVFASNAPLSVFQAVLPGGFATADRAGPVVKLDGSFLDKGISLGAKAALLKSASEVAAWNLTDTVPRLGEDGLPVPNPDGSGDPIMDIIVIENFPAYYVDYQEIVGGASLDIAKFAPVVGPSLVLGGSYGMYNVKHGDIGSSESALLSAFLNYNFYTRFSLLFGYQQLGTSVKNGDVETVKYTFDNLAVGLGYKTAEGGALTVKFTMLSGKTEPAGGTAVDYTAMQPEVYLTVKF
jgi:hypothetical protein